MQPPPSTSACSQRELEALYASELPPIEKLARAFDGLTAEIVAHAEREIELARALDDREERIKQQIKKSTLELARQLFDGCHRRALGRSLRHDQRTG